MLEALSENPTCSFWGPDARHGQIVCILHEALLPSRSCPPVASSGPTEVPLPRRGNSRAGYWPPLLRETIRLMTNSRKSQSEKLETNRGRENAAKTPRATRAAPHRARARDRASSEEA